MIKLDEYMKKQLKLRREPKPVEHTLKCKCEDCIARMLGEEIERHPICSPGRRPRGSKVSFLD